MAITLKNLQTKVTLNPQQILKIAKTILEAQGVNTASLCIVFVTRQRIQALNKKFLRRPYATDVLAFNSDEKNQQISGDIIISTDAAFKNAKTYETELSREITLYIIHGILHLLGYDDHASKDIKKMRKKEKEILGSLGTRPNKILK